MGPCKYVGSGKIVCPSVPAQTTKACLDGQAELCAGAADPAQCLLDAVETCVSVVGDTPVTEGLGDKMVWAFLVTEKTPDGQHVDLGLETVKMIVPSNGAGDECPVKAGVLIIQPEEFNTAVLRRTVIVNGPKTVAGSMGFRNYVEGGYVGDPYDPVPGEKLYPICDENICAYWHCGMFDSLSEPECEWEFNVTSTHTMHVMLLKNGK